MIFPSVDAQQRFIQKVLAPIFSGSISEAVQNMRRYRLERDFIRAVGERLPGQAKNFEPAGYTAPGDFPFEYDGMPLDDIYSMLTAGSDYKPEDVVAVGFQPKAFFVYDVFPPKWANPKEPQMLGLFLTPRGIEESKESPFREQYAHLQAQLVTGLDAELEDEAVNGLIGRLINSYQNPVHENLGTPDNPRVVVVFDSDYVFHGQIRKIREGRARELFTPVPDLVFEECTSGPCIHPPGSFDIGAIYPIGGLSGLKYIEFDPTASREATITGHNADVEQSDFGFFQSGLQQ